MPNNNKNITIVIPAYNEEKIIATVIDGIKTLKENYEILLVDDGSTDQTSELAEKAGARVIRHAYKKGNGAAVKTGIRNASGEIVVLMDGDGQHNPQDIPNLVPYIDKYDMVVGARGRGSETPFHRRLANKIYNSLATFVTQERIPDLTSGFRVLKREIAKKFLYLLPNTFSYPVTITLALLRAGYQVKYVPIKTLRRTGKSKIRPLADGIKFFTIILKIATLFSPFKIFLPVSILFFLLGLGYYCYTFIAYRRFTNMSVLLLTTAVVIFMLGLIAEQIALLRMERSEE